jgi:hypothetical protein
MQLNPILGRYNCAREGLTISTNNTAFPRRLPQCLPEDRILRDAALHTSVQCGARTKRIPLQISFSHKINSSSRFPWSLFSSQSPGSCSHSIPVLPKLRSRSQARQPIQITRLRPVATSTWNSIRTQKALCRITPRVNLQSLFLHHRYHTHPLRRTSLPTSPERHRTNTEIKSYQAHDNNLCNTNRFPRRLLGGSKLDAWEI